MDLRTIFFNKVGRLRSGWRVLLFVIGLFAIGFAMTTAVRVGYVVFIHFFPNAQNPFIEQLIYRFAALVVALVTSYGALKILEGLPWRSFGLTFHDRWLRDLVIGSVIGILSLALAVGIVYVGGGARFRWNLNLTGVIYSLVWSAFLFTIAALFEEAAFRGYPLQTLARAHLAWVGVLLTSLPFAAVHLANPNVVPLVTFSNTALAGVWLAVAYLRTRSLWFPLGVHWAWNWALGSIFGLPVSGLHLVSNPLLRASDTGPAWLTGGSYGLEGGVAGTVALLLSTLFIWRTRLISATPELLRLTSEENPAPRSDVLSIQPMSDDLGSRASSPAMSEANNMSD